LDKHKQSSGASVNPVEAIIDKQKPFVYLHAHVINREFLTKALDAKKSLEVDMSLAADGSVFIGHPLSFYQFKGLPPPDNLPLDDVLQAMKDAGLYLVLDVKDVRALPKAQETIKNFGANNVLLHAWADALLFKPYPPEIIVEPHWALEDLPLGEIEKVKATTGVPVVVSARGLTQKRLRSEGSEITQKIIDTIKGKAEAVNFQLPNGEAPSIVIMQKLLDEGILTWFNVDCVPAELRPPIYLGASDKLDSVSDPAGF